MEEELKTTNPNEKNEVKKSGSQEKLEEKGKAGSFRKAC